MNPKINYALVGLFVVLFSSALLAWIFWLGFGIEKKTYRTYVAYMSQSVAGLNTNAEVKYRGVDIGKVKSISLDPDKTEQVKLLLDIESEIAIKSDVVAVLATQGITGLGYIELSGGSKDAPLLEATEDVYPEIKTAPSLFVRLDKALSDLFTHFTTIAEEINGVSSAVKTLLNEQNIQAASHSLANVEQLTSKLNQQVARLDGHLDLAETILKNTANASTDFPGAMKNISTSMQNMQEIIGAIGKTTKNFDQAVLGTQQEVGRSAADTLVQMTQLFDELQRTAQALNRLLQDFERNPNMLIFGRKPERAGPGEK